MGTRTPKNGQLVISCQGAATVPYQNIENFQGNLKEITEEDYEKLKSEMLEYGFNSPIHVWKKGRKLYNLDGHQRVKVLHGLENEGYKIPRIPVDYIKARDLKQAKHILMSRVSQYGKTTPGGLYAFMADANMDIDEIKSSFRMPDIDMLKFEVDFLGMPKQRDKPGAQEVDGATHSNLMHTCPRCDFKFGKGAPEGGK